jgi:hypothetical protein
MRPNPVFWIAVLVLASCRQAPPPPREGPGAFTPEQLSAQFPADLGMDSVDVAAYPAEQRANYDLFVRECSKCHTPARALQSPYVKRLDWERFVYRMHEKAESRSGEKFGVDLLQGDAARRVIDFLVYDAQERKVRQAAEFNRRREELKVLFSKVESERTRRQVTEGQEKAREPSPYVGDRP